MTYQHKTARRAKPNLPMALDIPDVATELKFGETKVWGLIRTGEIESIKIGRHRRVPRASLEKFIARKLAEQSRGGAT